jgi:hypothetical protein
VPGRRRGIMDFRMRDFGTVLESRELARNLCTSFADEHKKNPEETVRLDFSGVRVVSKFFAEEFIGGLVDAVGAEVFDGMITFNNLSEMNRIWIERAITVHKSAPKAQPAAGKKKQKK